MNEGDAEHALALYKAIRLIDGRLVHLAGVHKFIAKLDIWATVSTGNYPIEVEIPRESPFIPNIRAAVEGQLLHERGMRAAGLVRLGFEVPPCRYGPTGADDG